MRSAPYARQRGVALVTAILLVALATALATKLAWDNQLNMRRTEAVLAQEQARQFALGAEGIAIDILKQDDAQYDNSSDDWAQTIPPLDVGIDENVLGQMQGRLFDAQGKLNLNNLVVAGSGQVDDNTGPTNSLAKFQRLFQILRLDPALVDAIVDWIDADTVPQGAGGEDDVYTGLDPPYRAANNYFVDVSELRTVLGMDPETYALLEPHVTALPPGWCGSVPTPVNLNFASAEVIAALGDMQLSLAQSLVEQREQNPWQTLADTGIDQQYLGEMGPLAAVGSNCFELQVIVNVGSSTLTMYSLLDRASNAAKIVTRVRAYGLDN